MNYVPITSIDYLERKDYSARELKSLEDGVRREAFTFHRWNAEERSEGRRMIRNPWRVGLLMFEATPLDLSNRDHLKLMLDKWYSRLRFQAPECWCEDGNVWDILRQIFDKYAPGSSRVQDILADLDRPDVYT